MKNFWISIFVVGLMVNMIFIGNAFAQQDEKQSEKQRVIEEELVLTDPTVSAEKKWLVGGSYEYWFVIGDYDTRDNAGNLVSKGDIKGDTNGGNIFIGYGNWTLQFSYKKGDWDISQRPEDDSTFFYDSKQDQKETEITIRYLMRGLSSSHFTPYLIAGYNETKLEETKTITTAGYTWSYNNKTVQKFDTTYKSPMLGIGAIIPFNKYIGIRGDILAAFTDAERKRDDGTTYTGDGTGGTLHLTGYWNIFKGLNLQVGFKGHYLNGGDAGTYDKGGLFGMLGYSYKF